MQCLSVESRTRFEAFLFFFFPPRNRVADEITFRVVIAAEFTREKHNDISLYIYKSVLNISSSCRVLCVFFFFFSNFQITKSFTIEGKA